MIGRYKARFLKYSQEENDYSIVHIFTFKVKIKSNVENILSFVTHELKQCLDVFGDNDYFKFCYQLAILANSKNVNFDDLKGKKCLVEVNKYGVTGVYPRRRQLKGVNNVR